ACGAPRAWLPRRCTRPLRQAADRLAQRGARSLLPRCRALPLAVGGVVRPRKTSAERAELEWSVPEAERAPRGPLGPPLSVPRPRPEGTLRNRLARLGWSRRRVQRCR